MIGNTKLECINDSVLDYADRHQLKIIMSIQEAKKLLGDYLDPVQHEAEEMIGETIIREPKPFPPAFPTYIRLNGEVFYNYIELRTVEILDDGTYIVNNQEQENCNFGIELRFNLNDRKRKIIYNMKTKPSSSNRELLIFLKMMKQASLGGNIEIFAYNLDKNILAGFVDPFIYETDFNDIDEEIDFLERVCCIEDFLGHVIELPKNIYEKEYYNVLYVSELLSGNENEFTWNEAKFKMIVDDHFRNQISEMEDNFHCMAFVGECNVCVFGEQINLQIIREYKNAKIKDLERFRKKLEYFDNGEEIEITYISGENHIFLDKLKPEGFPEIIDE